MPSNDGLLESGGAEVELRRVGSADPPDTTPLVSSTPSTLRRRWLSEDEFYEQEEKEEVARMRGPARWALRALTCATWTMGLAIVGAIIFVFWVRQRGGLDMFYWDQFDIF